MSKRVRVDELAIEADADLDEVIVALWDVGIDVDSPDDFIDDSLLKRAREALGIVTPAEQRKVNYWLSRLDMSRDEFAAALHELGLRLPSRARVLPKGAMRKLRRRYAHVVADPTESRLDVENNPCGPLEWQPIGTVREVTYLAEQEVRDVHYALVKDFAEADDPIDPPGVRSEDLLSSAVHRPMTSLGSDLKYPTVEMAAAALLHSLVLNHPFHNGNKRTGIVSMLVFLDRNGFMATCNERDLFRFVLLVAQHGLVPAACDFISDREVIEMAQWVRNNSRRVDKSERPIPWHRLRRILRGFACSSDPSGGIGNRINISRDVERRLAFGRTRHETLSTQVQYGGEGREADRSAIHKIRQDLELDEEHGVDSKTFYEAEALPDDFIQQYRTLLRRLARL